MYHVNTTWQQVVPTLNIKGRDLLQVVASLNFLYPCKTFFFPGGGGGKTGICLFGHVCVSVYVQSNSFCQMAGGAIKPHLVTALVFSGKGGCTLPGLLVPKSSSYKKHDIL